MREITCDVCGEKIARRSAGGRELPALAEFCGMKTVCLRCAKVGKVLSAEMLLGLWRALAMTAPRPETPALSSQPLSAHPQMEAPARLQKLPPGPGPEVPNPEKRRGRGRPRKAPVQTFNPEQEATQAAPKPVVQNPEKKHGRGRPRKAPVQTFNPEQEASQAAPKPVVQNPEKKHGRGRPRKVPTQTVKMEPEASPVPPKSEAPAQASRTETRTSQTAPKSETPTQCGLVKPVCSELSPRSTPLYQPRNMWKGPAETQGRKPKPAAAAPLPEEDSQAARDREEKRESFRKLSEYRSANGIGCLAPICEKTGYDISKLHRMLNGDRVDIADWRKVRLAIISIEEEEKESP